MKHALDGIRVLDVTQVMADLFFAMHLCDMGADVIKVEPRGGDTSRQWGAAGAAEIVAFSVVNRGKRGMVVDFKSAEGPAVVKRLAASSNVHIENYRPWVMARFGLGYATLRKENPALIYASISGCGPTGPHSDREWIRPYRNRVPQASCLSRARPVGHP